MVENNNSKQWKMLVNYTKWWKRMRNHCATQPVKNKKHLFCFLAPTKLHAKSTSSFSSLSVLFFDGPQATTVFPVRWLIFQDPPPLDAASTSSHCSQWFVVIQALNCIHFLISFDFLEVIFKLSGCFLQVR